MLENRDSIPKMFIYKKGVLKELSVYNNKDKRYISIGVEMISTLFGVLV